jgi:hypothetical protein
MNIKPKLFTLFLFILFANSVIAQNQFRSKVSGSWNEASTWERQSGDQWIAANAYPGTGADVIIQSNHEINIPAGISPVFSNLTINKNGVLNASAGVTLKIASGIKGGEFFIKNDGLIESGNIPAEGLIRVEVFTSAKKLTISGTGKTRIARLYVRGGNPNDLHIIIDTDLTITEKLVTPNFSIADVLLNRRTESDKVTLTINKGKTVIIEGASSFHSANNDAISGGVYTYNINGKLDFSANPISYIIPSIANNKTTINVGGELVLGSVVNGVSRNPVENVGALELNILDGGVVDATKNKRIILGSTQFITNGSGVLKK